MQTVGGYSIRTGRTRMCPMCGGAELRYTGEIKDNKETTGREQYKHRCIRCGLEFWFDGKYGK